jgi:hypothetical protein
MLLQYFSAFAPSRHRNAMGTARRQSVLRRGGAMHKKNGTAVKP